MSSVSLKIYIPFEKHLQNQICPKFLRTGVALFSLSLTQNLPVPKCRIIFNSFLFGLLAFALRLRERRMTLLGVSDQWPLLPQPIATTGIYISIQLHWKIRCLPACWDWMAFFLLLFSFFNGFSRPLSWTVCYSVPNISSVPANLTVLGLELSHDYFKNIFWLKLRICPCEHLFRSRTLIERITLVHRKSLFFQCLT